MANVTRWDPFEDHSTICSKAFFCARCASTRRRKPVRIRVDVKEDDKAYVVHAEIPGVKKEDIQVSIDGNQVAISAEVKRQKEEKQGGEDAAHRALLRQGLPRLRAWRRTWTRNRRRRATRMACWS